MFIRRYIARQAARIMHLLDIIRFIGLCFHLRIASELELVEAALQ